MDSEYLDHHGPADEKKRHPILWLIVGLILVLIFILSLVPLYSVKVDPMPKNVPGTEILPNFQPTINKQHKIRSYEDFNAFITPNEPLIKQLATKIVTQSCDGNRVCYAKAIFMFVHDNFDYVSESDEYIELPQEVLYTGGSDCDGASILMANFLQAVGFETRFVFIPGHVYVEIYLPEALKKYKTADGWVALDATCEYCGFGEIPYQNKDSEKQYVY